MEFYDTGDDAFVKVDRALQFTTSTYTRSYTDYTTHIYDSEEFTLERVGEIPRIFTVFYAFTQRRVGLEWERGGGSGGADGSRHGSYSPSYSDRR